MQDVLRSVVDLPRESRHRTELEVTYQLKLVVATVPDPLAVQYELSAARVSRMAVMLS